VGRREITRLPQVRGSDAVRPRHRRGFLSDRFNRREFLRMTGAAGMGIGLAVLGWLPPMMRRACACHTTYSVQDNCSGVSYGQSGDCAACCTTCPSVVGPGYCCEQDGQPGKNWHRHGQEGNTDYSVRLNSCSGGNAWRWTVHFCCDDRDEAEWRCSDGRYRTCNPDCSAWNPSVCKHLVNNGNPC
jgi:hypothetical protein